MGLHAVLDGNVAEIFCSYLHYHVNVLVGPLGKKRSRERGIDIAANFFYNPNVSKLNVHPRKFVF